MTNRDQLYSLVYAVDQLSVAATRDLPVERKAASAVKHIRRMALLLGIGVTEEEAYEWLQIRKPEPPDPAKPMQGARIVGGHLYVIGGGQRAAIRKRPDRYELVVGVDKYGTTLRPSNKFSGYRWDTLIGTYFTVTDAYDVLMARWPTAKQTRNVGK